MTDLKAIDVHGFGGGFTLGAVQAGFELVGKKSREVGFGVLNTMANRHLLGTGWEVQSEEPAMWTPEEAQLVFGNPPCSGFSTLSPKHFRGDDSSINECMWELVRYAGKVAPEIVIWESVQQAFTQGINLMRALHAELEEISGHKYTLHHVLHNNAALGGASIRRRYFWVASRIPFGVEWNATTYDFQHHETVAYDLDRVPSLNDIFGDLEHLDLTMNSQPYRGVVCACNPEPHEMDDWECRCGQVEVTTGSWWTKKHMHDGTGRVDGHDIFRSPTYYRAKELLESGVVDWEQGDRISDVLRKYYQKMGDLPASWHYASKKPTLDANGEPIFDENGKKVMQPIDKAQRLIETDFAMGHNQTARWHGNRMARVITGGAVHLILHPNQPRTLTQREAARIQGFPDAWRIWPVRNAPDLGPGWGKGVPVHAGRWIAYWAKQALLGNPGSMVGEAGEDRERIIDVTNRYKPFAMAIGDKG